MWESAEEITASCAQRPLSLRPGPAIPELWGGWLSGPGRDGSHFARRWCGVRAALSTGGSVYSRPAGTWHGIYSEQLLELLLKQEDMHLEPGSSVWQALFFMASRRPRRSGYGGGVGVGVGLFFIILLFRNTTLSGGSNSHPAGNADLCVRFSSAMG